jgi:hypothetical protein
MKSRVKFSILLGLAFIVLLLSCAVAIPDSFVFTVLIEKNETAPDDFTGTVVLTYGPEGSPDGTETFNISDLPVSYVVDSPTPTEGLFDYKLITEVYDQWGLLVESGDDATNVQPSPGGSKTYGPIEISLFSVIPLNLFVDNPGSISNIDYVTVEWGRIDFPTHKLEQRIDSPTFPLSYTTHPFSRLIFYIEVNAYDSSDVLIGTTGRFDFDNSGIHSSSVTSFSTALTTP